eukprot:364039-Chlamydomonas_euryale.AAC.3
MRLKKRPQLPPGCAWKAPTAAARMRLKQRPATTWPCLQGPQAVTPTKRDQSYGWGCRWAPAYYHCLAQQPVRSAAVAAMLLSAAAFVARAPAPVADAALLVKQPAQQQPQQQWHPPWQQQQLQRLGSEGAAGFLRPLGLPGNAVSRAAEAGKPPEGRGQADGAVLEAAHEQAGHASVSRVAAMRLPAGLQCVLSWREVWGAEWEEQSLAACEYPQLMLAALRDAAGVELSVGCERVWAHAHRALERCMLWTVTSRAAPLCMVDMYHGQRVLLGQSRSERWTCTADRVNFRGGAALLGGH